MPDFFAQELRGQLIRVFALSVGADLQTAVHIHDQHVTGGVVGAQHLTAANDGAVFVAAEIIRVDGQHRARALHQLAQGQRLSRGVRCLKGGDVFQLHVADKIDAVVFLIAVYGDGTNIVLIRSGIGLGNAFGFPFRLRGGNGQAKQQKQ